jgi:hypothetical protein
MKAGTIAGRRRAQSHRIGRTPARSAIFFATYSAGDVPEGPIEDARRLVATADGLPAQVPRLGASDLDGGGHDRRQHRIESERG